MNPADLWNFTENFTEGGKHKGLAEANPLFFMVGRAGFEPATT